MTAGTSKAPRKRGRPPGDSAPARKKKTGVHHGEPLSNAGVGIVAPPAAVVQRPSLPANFPLSPLSRDPPSARPANMNAMLSPISPYLSTFATGSNRPFVTSPAMSNIAIDTGYFPHEHGHHHMYELGDATSDNTPGSPAHFVHSPMLAVPATNMAYATNPYMSQQMANDHHQQYQQLHGLGIHPSAPFFDPATGLIVTQVGRQQYMMPTPMVQHAPMMQVPRAAPASPLVPGATPRLNTGSQGTPRLLSASMPHIGSTPLHPPSPHAPTMTPRLPSATLAVPTVLGAPASSYSPTMRRAPTPMGSMASPSIPSAARPPHVTPNGPYTPVPLISTAPRTFVSTESYDSSASSTSSSELSSAPPQSPVIPSPAVARQALPTTQSPMGDHSACISVSVYAATMGQLQTARNQNQSMRAQLVTADRPNSEDVAALKKTEVHLLARLDELSKANRESDELVYRLGDELAGARQQAAEAYVLVVQLREECARLAQESSTHQGEFAKANGYVHALTTRVNSSEASRAVLVQQLAARDQEVAGLRADVAEAHDKVAHLVSVTGVNLAEVSRECSPSHLSAPPLERSNSHSFPFPPTPIYTPLQALPMESLPSSGGSEPMLSPGLPRAPVRSASLPAVTPTPTPTPAHITGLCHTPSPMGDSGLGVTLHSADSGSASPWKSWLQLDTAANSN